MSRVCLRLLVSVVWTFAISCKDEPEEEIDCPAGEVAAKESCVNPETGEPTSSMLCVTACETDEDCDPDWEYCERGKEHGKCVPQSTDDCTIS